MNLLYDFRAYQEFYPRGVSRYVYELFVKAIEINEGGNCVLLDLKKQLPCFPETVKEKVKLYDVEMFKQRMVDDKFDVFINGSTTWLGLQKYNSLDMLYPECVLKYCKKTTCILYDFVPLLYSNYLPNIKDQINYFMQCEAMSYMDHIFTISKYISSSGARYLNRSLKDFTCLYGGADEKNFHTENSEKKYSWNNRTNNIVNVSGICERKNFVGVTEAFGKAYNSGKIPRNSKLIIICSTTDSFIETIKAAATRAGVKYGKQVLASGYISDDEMVQLISTAKCSIYPSYYEGLGLPILESYTAGTPCIASNVSSTKELVLKEASFNPFDINNMAEKIIEVYNNEQLCRDSLEFGRNLIKIMNWKESAKTLINKLEVL